MNKELSKEEQMFRYDPIWKTLIKIVLPSMVMMLVFGSYFFFDNVLSINFAEKAYQNSAGNVDSAYAIPGMDGASLIRIFMNGYSPINSLMVALASLLGIGTSTRVAINLGKRDRERAKRTLRTGFMSSIILALILTPVLIMVAKAWIESQYKSFSAESISIIGNESFKYAWPVIMTFPLMMFNQVIPSMLRTEARMKEMMIAMVLPIFINLGLDWVFMGYVGMGVEGGAWATFIATSVTSVILIFFISKSKKTSLLRWKILIGRKFKLIAIVGISLVGLAPFLRNISQSITSSVQTNIINDVSNKVFIDDYIAHWDHLTKAQGSNNILNSITIIQKQDPHKFEALKAMFAKTLLPGKTLAETISWNIVGHIPVVDSHLSLSTWTPGSINSDNFVAYQVVHGTITGQSSSAMISIMSAAMPIFILFFPIMFAFAQAARPIASFNYGARLFNRVRSVYWWTMLYSTIAGVSIYFIISWGISGPLINLLRVENGDVVRSKELAADTLKIIMIAMITFSLAISAMVIFGSTDRVILSVISSSLQGLILFWPIIFGFRELAINHPQNNLLFFWYISISSASASIVSTLMVIRTLWKINRKYQVTLDDRIDAVYVVQKHMREKRLACKQARKDGNLKEVKAHFKEKRKKDIAIKKNELARQQAIVDKQYALLKRKKAIKN